MLSCKKKKAEPENPAEAVSTPDSPYSNTSSSTFHAFLNSGIITTISGSSVAVSKYSSAYFSDTLAANINHSKLVNGVKVDNQNLVYNTSDSLYLLGNMAGDLKGEVWEINGANQMPSFKHTNDNQDPSFVTSSPLPDSISISAGFTLNITCSNILYGPSSVSVGGGLSSVLVKEMINNGSNTIVFTPTTLAVLVPDNFSLLLIELQQRKGVEIYGKKIQLQRDVNIQKTIKVKP